MGKFIVKLEGHYFEWSSVVDAPVTEPMTLADFTEYYQREYGAAGLHGLQHRLDEVEMKGTSALLYDSVEELLSGNRAGPNESELSLDALKRWARRARRT